MYKLKSTKLHDLIGARTEWGDDLWDEALFYLGGRLGTDEAVVMAETIGIPADTYVHKTDFLQCFKFYPPTMMLGAFDFMRHLSAAYRGGAAAAGPAEFSRLNP